MKKIIFLFLLLLVSSKSFARVFMSYNVQHCNIGGAGVVDERQTAAVINKVHPDICALQELDSCNRRSSGYQLQLLAAYTNMHYTYARTISYQGGAYGIGLLSKEKPLSVKRIPLPGNEARALLVCEFSDYVFTCTHLALEQGNRLTSLNILLEEAGRWEKPFFVAGDFNAKPGSAEITLLKQHFTLLNDETQPTHPANAPKSCIDYIALYNGNMASQSQIKLLDRVVMDEPTVSDHRPISVWLTDWTYKCPCEPLPLSVETIVDACQASGRMPADFPCSGSHGGAYQATAVHGVVYANDCNARELLGFTAMEQPHAEHYETYLQGSSSYGIASDDAGCLILRNDDNGNTPHQLILHSPYDKSRSSVIDFTLPHPGKTSFISASGDVFSNEGGYVYFYPNGQYYVDMLHVRNGQLMEILSSDKLTVPGSNSYVIPVNNNPRKFYYQVRTKGFFLHDITDKGLVFPYESVQAPRLNATTGGAYLVLDDHELLVHPSGPNFNGGFSIKDLSANYETVFTAAPLGTAGIKGNLSGAQFFKVEQVSSSLAYLYVYALGSGYAVYLLKTPKATHVPSATVPAPQTHGTIYDITGRKVDCCNMVRGGIYIENHKKLRR